MANTRATSAKTTDDNERQDDDTTTPDQADDTSTTQEPKVTVTGEIETAAQARARKRRELENELTNLDAEENAAARRPSEEPTHVLILAGGYRQVPHVGTGGTHHWHDGELLPVTSVIPLAPPS